MINHKVFICRVQEFRLVEDKLKKNSKIVNWKFIAQVWVRQCQKHETLCTNCAFCQVLRNAALMIACSSM